jgi:hypothetical protein
MTDAINKKIPIWNEARLRLRMASLDAWICDAILERLVAPHVVSVWLATRGFPDERAEALHGGFSAWVMSGDRTWSRLWHGAEEGPLILRCDAQRERDEEDPEKPGYEVLSLRGVLGGAQQN